METLQAFCYTCDATVEVYGDHDHDLTIEGCGVIHYKCGGNLIPIPDPGGVDSTEFARCDRCRLSGMVCDPPSLDTEQVSV